MEKKRGEKDLIDRRGKRVLTLFMAGFVWNMLKVREEKRVVKKEV